MRAKKTDKNQFSIVDSLRKCGVQVVLTSDLGKDFPDLLFGWNSVWVLAEVKTSDGEISRGQIEFLRDAKGYIGIVTDFESALRLAKRPEVFALSGKEKQLIASFLLRWDGARIAYRKFEREVLGR